MHTPSNALLTTPHLSNYLPPSQRPPEIPSVSTYAIAYFYFGFSCFEEDEEEEEDNDDDDDDDDAEEEEDDDDDALFVRLTSAFARGCSTRD